MRIEIDRPLGSRHPEHGFIYPLNYGYVPGFHSGDGEELDAYVLGISVPLQSFEGRCIAVIRRLNDDDDKLVLAPGSETYSDDEIHAAVSFQEQFFDSIILRSS